MGLVEVVGRDPAASPQNLIHGSTRGREVAPGTVHEARSVIVSIPGPRVLDTHTHTHKHSELPSTAAHKATVNPLLQPRERQMRNSLKD